MMRAQRVREGESRIEMQVAKWTAEGAVKGIRIGMMSALQTRIPHQDSQASLELLSILRRRAYVNCREYEGIPQKCTGQTVNQGGTTGEV